ncbi:methyltransferase domain-containing protein [Flavobacterium sp.]|uniref:methyltransferase domain-containing protein n=1 Tax=Flavobacterium sp. TaxID=239 RepID=UPI0026262262|nr:methyltransferase domain-containing protein [Flavobacterium sp.]
MSLNTKQRTDAPEIMDDFSLEGQQLSDALDKIAKINQWLGGNALTLKGVETLIRHIPKETQICIVDLGCGNGDMLRSLADYAKKNQRNFRLIGIDANPFTVNYAKESSKNDPDIEYLTEDIFSFDYKKDPIDIVLCTLTLHHFKDQEILQLMQTLNQNAKIGIVVNDLHRSKIAYRLFQLICFLFRLNPMSKEDGLTSILRGFKKEELVAFSKQLNLTHYTIDWKWAFRYQWIIYKP